MDNLHIYLLAGVKTRDSAFYTLLERLEKFLDTKQVDASIEILYPYGDHTRKLWKQILDLCIDVNFINKYCGIGGRRVKHKIEHAAMEGKNRFLLIGHSGGGVAAYRLARFLHYRFNLDIEDIKVVQIGSPKMKVSPRFQSHITYVQAVDNDGKPKDPITKIGYWGGLHFRRDAQQKRGWSKQKYAPAHVKNIPLIGGHTDYFRTRDPFIDEHAYSNLDYTFKAFENWLNEWI